MTRKLIQVPDYVYAELTKRKRPGETYGGVIASLLAVTASLDPRYPGIMVAKNAVIQEKAKPIKMPIKRKRRSPDNPNLAAFYAHPFKGNST